VWVLVLWQSCPAHDIDGVASEKRKKAVILLSFLSQISAEAAQ
jgi:hypothetical protein